MKLKIFLKAKLLSLFLMMVVSVMTVNNISAQTVRYQQNIQGGATIIGNSWFYTNSSTVVPPYPYLTKLIPDVDSDGSTTLSTYSDLLLPAGSTIVKAYLSVESGMGAYSSSDAINSVKLKVPGASSYVTLTNPGSYFLTQRTRQNPSNTSVGFTQTIFDITPLIPGGTAGYAITTAGSAAGRYYLADPTTRPVDMGGWSIIIVYSNPNSKYRNVSVTDNWQVYSNSTINTDIPNVRVPSVGSVKAVIGVTGTYGDRSPQYKDQLLFGNATGTLTALADPMTGTTDDALNSSIAMTSQNNVTSDGGATISGNVTTRQPISVGSPYGYDGTQTNLTAEAWEYDADVFDATGKIPPSATPITVRLTQTNAGLSSSDILVSGSYFVSVDLATEATLTKAISPSTIIDGGTTTYTWTVTNTSASVVTLNNLGFTDNLPTSIKVATTPNVVVTGGTGAVVTATAGSGTVTLSSLTLASGAVATIKVDVTNVPGQTNASCAANPTGFTNSASNVTATTGGIITTTMTPACLIVTPVCTAGTAQVPVTSNILIPCGTSTVNLATAHAGTAPGVSSLVWFTTANRSTTALTSTEAVAAGPGTYYAFYYDATANCYNTTTSTSAVTVSAASCGYIYLHHQATNEEGSPNFSYTLSGGGALTYTLNDQTDFLSSEDLGASQSGRLWALARTVSDTTFNNWKVYYRDVNNSTWTAITTLGSPRAIDGGIGSTAIYSTNATSGTTGRVYSIAADGTTTDITGNLPAGIVYDISDNWLALGSGGRQYAAVQNGNIYQRTTSALPAVWTVIANSPSHRVDAVPKTNNLYYVVGNSTTTGSTVFYRDVTAASSINLGTASNSDDMAITEDGTVIAGYKKMNGTPGGTVTWTDDVQGMYGFNVTGGPNNQFWSSVGITNVNNGNTSVRPNRIMTRTATGSWIDDERIRATGTHNDNSVLLSLIPGTYKITENTEPSGWRLQSILSDPTMTTDIATKSATITVAANGTTNLVFSNVNDVASAMPTDCTGFTENFGTTEANYASPTISSAYHNGASTINGTSSSAMGYGYYGLIKNSNLITGDLASGNGVEYTTGFTDHTSGTGRMLGVNATGQSRIFYQKRLTGLLIGTSYNYSVWVRSADINAGNLPNVGLQVLDPITGAVLFSGSSGTIANANPPAAWKQVTLNFTATTTSIDLALVSLTAGAWGNDFAVDDISLIPVKPTAPIIGTITQPTCAVPTGSVALSGLPATGTWTLTDTNGGATMSGSGSTATFDNLAAGNHTFTITLGGCISTASAAATINAAPAGAVTLGTITGPTCILPPITGQVYSVPAVAGATTYTWTYNGAFGPGAGITSGLGTNSITVTFGDGALSGTLSVTATTACGVSGPSTLAINVLPKPSIVTVGESTICPSGGSVILTSTPAAAYQWYKDGVIISGATNQNYTAAVTGAYTVVTSSGSCTSVASDAFNVLAQDGTAPVFVSPLGVTTKSVKIDFRNVSTTTVSLPQIYKNIETGALAGEEVTVSQSTTTGSAQGTTASLYPSTADATGPAAYGNTNLLFIKNVGDVIRTVAFNFKQPVTNLKFSMFDLDGTIKLEARAYNNGSLQPITITPLKTVSPNANASASPSTTPTIIGVTNAYSLSSIAQMRIAGINVDVPGPANSFILAATTRTNGDTDYYISQISYDYTAPILPPDVTVNCDAIPAPVILTATDNCSPASVTYTQVPAAYTSSATATNLVRTWTAIDSSGNTSVYTQTITVNPVATPVLASANQNICATNYSTLANIAITGTNIKWYADATTITALPSTTVLTNNATYYATQTLSGGCESSRVPVTVALRNCSWVNPSLRSKASK